MSEQPPLTTSCLARVAAVFEAQAARPLTAGLYLVATPIGNLADITLRALATLATVDVIYCEDTRHSRILLGHFAIGVPLRAYHEHNAAEVRPEILASLAAGRRIALISDAGTPLVSDPGYKLVRAAIDAGQPVTALPGASSVLAALTLGGLPTDAFHFAGFLPPKMAGRRAALQALRDVAATLVIFEAPGRLAALLADMADVLGPRDVAVARELTKLHEEVRRGRPADLAAAFTETPPRGEIVVLVGPAAVAPPNDADILARLEVALATSSVRDAADLVAGALGVARSRVYALALSQKPPGGRA